MNCHCGCGQKTKIATETHASKGIFRGKPLRFVQGHQRRVRMIPEEAVPFKLDGAYCRFIALPDGYIAIVSTSDYDELSRYKWHLKRDRSGRTYAVRKGLIEHGQRHCQIAMHRQILGLLPGDKREGDHMNSDTLNNSRTNLRIATDKGQARNARIRSDNTLGLKGVQRHGGGWRYRIWTDNGRYNSGIYPTAEAAFNARCIAANRIHGEFARTR